MSHNLNRNNYLITAASSTTTIAAIFFTLITIFASNTTTIVTPVAATSTTGNSTTATTTMTPSSELEFSAQPIWDELATTTGRTQINETHSIIYFIGNGTMTVPDTGETINMTNNGSGLVSPIPGYTDTVSAYGREHVFSVDDGDTSAITFYEIIRYDPTTFEGSGLVIAVFDRNATGMLAPFNGMMVVGTHEEDPSAQVATVRLWEWQGGLPLPTPNATSTTIGGAPLMNTTTTAIDAATVVETNTTSISEGEAEAGSIGGLSEEQQQFSVEEQRQAVE